MKRSKTTSLIKWACAGTCLLSAAGLAASLLGVDGIWYTFTGGTSVGVQCEDSTAMFMFAEPGSQQGFPASAISGQGWHAGRFSQMWPESTRVFGFFPLNTQDVHAYFSRRDRQHLLELPLWPLLILGGAVIAWLWRRDRMVIPGTCTQCRYDLTGNTSGVCPECGLSVPPKQPPSVRLAS